MVSRYLGFGMAYGVGLCKFAGLGGMVGFSGFDFGCFGCLRCIVWFLGCGVGFDWCGLVCVAMGW